MHRLKMDIRELKAVYSNLRVIMSYEKIDRNVIFCYPFEFGAFHSAVFVLIQVGRKRIV